MADLPALNALPPVEARSTFLGCCGSTRWAVAMTAGRPFATAAELSGAADEVWARLDRADWLEAFAAHPRIGDLEALQKKYSGDWCAGEQGGVAGANEVVLRGLA